MKKDDRANWVNQGNALIEGRQRLKLNSAKLVRVAIMSIRMTDTELTPCHITVPELAELFDIEAANLYTAMPGICKELAQSIVEVKEVKKGRVYFEAMPWVSNIVYDSNKGVTIQLNDKLKPYVLKLRGSYTRYFLEEILTMNSVYAIRIFELLMNRKKCRLLPLEGMDIEISVQDIKDACGCTSKAYDSFHNVKNRVIDIAVKEINEKTNYLISNYTYVKEGKSVVAVIFHLEQFKYLKSKSTSGVAV